MLLGVSILTPSILMGCSAFSGEEKTTSSEEASGLSYPGKMVVWGFDFGPSVSKVIIDIPDTGNEPVTTDMFSVTEEKKDADTSFSEERKIRDAYYSDADGNRADDLSAFSGNLFLSIELSESPDEGDLLYFDDRISSKQWFSDYTLHIKKEGTRIASITEKVFPQIEKVDTKGSFTGKEGHTFAYASFVPENASEDNKQPLVIWLHGGGESGTDPSAAVYGNEVVALFGEEFQTIMDGAYVLVPLCPTAWIETKDEDDPDSIYLHDLHDLIDSYADSHHVDKERILVGGCSNGGYMTLDLLLNYPTYFSAAFPVCEIFDPEQIPSEKLSAIKDIPMWFVYAENDRTVPPATFEEPLLQSLASLGAKNIHVSVFPDIHDTTGRYLVDGEPYQYYGHFSWIRFFNNECTDGSLTIWQFLSEN